jgi:hypothetical protein
LCTIQEKIIIFSTDNSNDCRVYCDFYLSLESQCCGVCYLYFIVHICSIFYELCLCVLGVSVRWEICTLYGRILSSIQSNSQVVQKCKKIRNSIQYFFDACLYKFLRDHFISNVFSVCAKHRLFASVYWHRSCLLGGVYVVYLSSVWHKACLSRGTGGSQNKGKTWFVTEAI